MHPEDRIAVESLAAPDAALARQLGSAWERYMRLGEFERAWQISDRVQSLRRGHRADYLPRHFQWIWTGEELAGKCVLIRCYHGLGDTIQFVRYAPLVRRVAKRVVLWAQPPLIPVLRTMQDAFDELLPLSDGAPPCEYDADVELMELPHLFRTTLQTIPNEVPYLHVNPTQLPASNRLNVGVLWKAGDWDDRRSVPFGLLCGLADSVEVNWHVLQRGPALEEWQGEFGVNSGTDDVFAVARLIKALDLLLSIDSMPAHLAGALGVPTWTLLQRHPDWRWMQGSHETPWYPTMRLFRQSRRGDWTGVIASVKNELAGFVKERGSAARSFRKTSLL